MVCMKKFKKAVGGGVPSLTGKEHEMGKGTTANGGAFHPSNLHLPHHKKR